MKKVIVYILAFVALSLGIVACNDPKPEPPFTLAGTTWQCEIPAPAHTAEYTKSYIITYEFTSEVGGNLKKTTIFKNAPASTLDAKFTASYKKPLITLSEVGEKDGGTMTLTVDEKAGTMTSQMVEGFQIVLKKIK